MKHVLIFLAVLGCGHKEAAPPAATSEGSGRTAGSGTPEGSGSGSPLPAGWRREDLSKPPHGFVASIALPGDAKVASEPTQEADADGLVYAIPMIKINVQGAKGALELKTSARPDWKPPTKAEAHSHSEQFKLVTEKQLPTGEWAFAKNWGSSSECFVHGASPRARVTCDAEFQIPCDMAAAVVDMCLSLEPAGPPLKPNTDPKLTFDKLSDSKAVEAAARIARAIARNDRPAVLEAVGPRGVRLYGKQLARDALSKRFESESTNQVFKIDCARNLSAPDPEMTGCQWMAEAEERNGTFTIASSEASGLVPAVSFNKTPEGTWLLTTIAEIDHGQEVE